MNSRPTWRSIDEDTPAAPPAWRALSEPAPASTALAPTPPATPIPDANREIVIRGIPAAQVLRDRHRFTVGSLVLLLRRAFSFGISALAHLCLFILAAGVVLFLSEEKDEIVTVFAGTRGGGEQGPQDEGKKEDKNQPTEEIEKLPDDTVQPTPEQPKPEVEPTPVPAPGPAPETPAKPLPSDRQLEGRGGSRRGDLLKQFGGNEASESAVERGLEWLAAHQSKSGAWDAEEFHEQCPKSYCRDTQAIGDRAYTPGTTALSVLAFLGAGYTHLDGSHAKTVAGGLEFLMSIQEEDGGFTQFSVVNFYNQAICTWAVAEAYAFTRDERLRKPAQRGLDFLVEHQYPGGGWDYLAQDDPDLERNDTSIAGWAVMAMKSGKMAGLEVPQVAFDRVAKLIDSRTVAATGELVYAERRPGVGRKGDGLVAVGMLCRFYLGLEDVRPLREGARRLSRSLPDWDAMLEACKRTASTGGFDTDQNMYVWYYGTLAMFQIGGDYWTRWNVAMRDMLLARQRADGHAKGSWDPERNYIGREGGRVFATAINVLNLEIYYRYLPLYTLDPRIAERLKWDDRREYLEQARRAPTNGERLRAMQELAQLKGDADVTKMLSDLLSDPDAMIRLAAARLLAQRNDKSALPALLDAIRKDEGMTKGALLEQVGRLGDPSTLPFLISHLSDPVDRVSQGAWFALKQLTGQDLGRDAKAWSRYWEENRPK